MAEPPRVEQLPYNWSTPRGTHAIEAIIAHGTVGTDSRAYLSDGGPRRVSIHALIQKPGNPIYRYVPDNIGANHAGFGTMPHGFSQVNPNLITLGFELENLQDGKDPYTDSQLLAMGWWVNDARAKHGPLPILRHADIDPTRRSDTVGLTVAQIEAWAVRARAYFADPLRARTLPGVPGMPAVYCSIAAASFYAVRGGLRYNGYPRRDMFHDASLNANVLVCERVIIKESAQFGVEQALLSEAVREDWIS